MTDAPRAVMLLLVAVCPLASCSGPAAPPKPTPPAGSKAAARAFVKLLAEGDFAGAVRRYDRTMARTVPEATLKAAWQSVVALVGPFRKQLGVRTAKVKQYDVVFVTCQFEKGRMDVKVVLDRAGKVSGLFIVPARPPAVYKPPAYARPDAFDETGVTLGLAPFDLDGTVSIPNGPGPFPAVVLVHGSGPHDRDETIGPNKPFRDLAWGLASRGIAALRYEKRTKAHAAKVHAVRRRVVTVKDETIDDALHAVVTLRLTDRIDPKRIFVVGHSLGGMLVPRIAARDAKVAGFIILAGTTRPLEDVILEQMNYLASLDGQVTAEERTKLEELKAQVANVKDANLSPGTSSADLLLGAPAAYWLDLRPYRPADAAAKMTRPLLILQGQRDYQVTMDDLQGWKAALTGRANVTFKVYPKLNHLFIAGEGKPGPADYEQAANVSPDVVKDIADWIGATKRP
jgi:dienelactone hydrolase